MIETRSTAKIIDDYYIELHFLRENVSLDLEEVKEGWDLALSLDPTYSKMVLLKCGKSSLLEKDARDFVTKQFKLWPQVAVIVDNIGQRLMGQVIINLIGNTGKVKVFDKEEKAKNWLLNSHMVQK